MTVARARNATLRTILGFAPAVRRLRTRRRIRRGAQPIARLSSKQPLRHGGGVRGTTTCYLANYHRSLSTNLANFSNYGDPVLVRLNPRARIIILKKATFQPMAISPATWKLRLGTCAISYYFAAHCSKISPSMSVFCGFGHAGGFRFTETGNSGAYGAHVTHTGRK